MTDEIFYSVNEWIFIGVFLLVLLLFYEISFRLGKKWKSSLDPTQKSHVGNVEAAILGLLGLLLAFTFSMAVTRFEARKALVMEEANAIGTAYLRTEVLEEPSRSKIQELLKNYLRLRIEYYESRATPQSTQEFLQKNERLQGEFWLEAVLAAKQSPTVLSGLLLQSLNEVIDLHSARVVAMRNHVPEIVLILLCLVSVIGLGAVGYASGLSNHRNTLAMMILSLLISSIVLVIVDMDRPRRGLIQVRQQALIDLHRSLPQEK